MNAETEVIKKYSNAVIQEQNQELNFMFRFANVINEIQIKIVEARIAKVPEERIKPSIEMMDELLSILKSFDSFYFNAHMKGQKIVQLEGTVYKMGLKIIELEKENLKLLESLEWK